MTAPTIEERLEALHAELDEYNVSLAKLRHEIKYNVEDSEVPFHQDVLIKLQHTAWDVEREIIRITPKEE